MERDLLTGERQALLEDYFGEESYRDLVDLAREAAPRGTRGGARVLILPGFLGSTLGKNRIGPFDDVLWFDPIDIFNGRLSALALDEKPASSPWKALGAVEFTYLRLKLNLIRDGYDADFHPFDWRQSVEVSARRLLRRLASESAPLISLVAHSMGGLVLRAAMGIARKERHPALKKIRRVVTIGAPHSGSFAGVQVLRGNHGTLRKVAALDRKHDAAWLASNVLSTFPGLYETLPVPEKTGPIPLYDASSWPATGPRPRQALLDRVAAVRALLAPGSDKIFVIAGVDVRTVVALHPGSGEFLYDVSNEGDGTIPVSLALLPDARTWFVKSEHGSQPNSPLIARAVAEILDRGETAALPETWKVSRAAAATKVPESEVHSSIFGATKLASAGTVRRTFEEFASPDFEPRNSMSGSVTRPTFPKKSDRSVEVRVVLGDITAVSARAYALGLFQDVTPGGAARDLDEKLDGAITEMTLRRMFLGGVGQIYMLPVSRSGLLTEVITFVGLGAFDRFSEGVQEIAAENVIRALLRSNVEEVATVLIGSGSGSSVSRSLRTLMTGFLRGLNDADPEQRFRRVILCEKNPEKYQEIRNAVHQLLEQEESPGVRWTVEEQTLKERPEVVVPRSATAQPLVTGGDQPVYLIVRVERHSQREQVLRASVLTAGPKAAVITGWRPFSSTRLARLLTPISRQTFHRDSLRTIGNDLAAELLDDSVRAVLPTMRERHLVVVHDAESSRVPWEILCLGDWFPAAEAGLSHRYAAENLSVAKWLEERREDGTLSMLLVVNPTEDLSGAEAEGDRIQSIFGGKRQVRIAELRGPDATRPALISAFRSGAYDVVHYAGHAFFEPGNPSQSGLLCHGGEVLSGADLAGLAGLPTLVFFNACESGRVRGRTPGRLTSRVQESAGLAEAFLRGGVANFLGTYWPVGDSAAEVFASTFYQGLLGGEMIGKTIQKSRRRVMALGKQDGRDWADYLYYGDPLFVLKKAM